MKQSTSFRPILIGYSGQESKVPWQRSGEGRDVVVGSARTLAIHSCIQAVLLAWILVLFGMTARGEAADSAKTPKAGESDSIFTNLTVLRLQIEVSARDMNILRRSPGGFGGWGKRPVVKATVREGDRVYTNVSLHLKGAAGSFRPVDDNPALTLNFAKFVTNQTFHGLHKLSLNNSVQDPSFLTERICRELFDAAGVPVPRAAHATVQLNGQELGLRVLVEGYSKQFLKRYFKNAKGNLYDGGFVQDINAKLALNSGDNPNDQSPLRRALSAATDPNPATRWNRLNQTVDLERFISFIAMEIMQCHWDGYALNRNNYRVYHDPDSNKIIFMPHGLDQMFGVERSSPSAPILPQMEGAIASGVMQTPEGRQHYLERMAQLYTNVFKVEQIVARVDQLADLIRPAIAATDPGTAQWHAQQVNALKRRIIRRGESLKHQLGLAQPATLAKFDTTGVLRLLDWKSQTDKGEANYEQATSKLGRPLLHITVANGATASSWRAQLSLTPGRYKFEGNLQVSGVVPEEGDPRGGVCLRISRGVMPKKLTGTTNWIHASYDFDVTDPSKDVEFVCELRGTAGEAWFDVQSLVVRRQ